jgi:hypothetical protein
VRLGGSRITGRLSRESLFCGWSRKRWLSAGLQVGVFRVEFFPALCIGLALAVFCADGFGGVLCIFFDADGFGVVVLVLVLVLFKILVLPDLLAEGSISRIARVENNIVA